MTPNIPRQASHLDLCASPILARSVWINDEIMGQEVNFENKQTNKKHLNDQFSENGEKWSRQESGRSCM